MPTHLHLFSSPGENDIRYIVDASCPYLENRNDPVVTYMPLASLYAERWLELNETAFKGLARLQTINTEVLLQKEIENIIRESSLIYIPGGNTFLLTHRLHISGVIPYIQKKVQAGLPVVAFSAGSIVCGPNILTSKDMNSVGSPYFEGINATPFNFSPHYPLDAHGQSMKDEWLSDYHFFYDNPIVMLSDGAYVKVNGRKTTLVRGEAWIWRKDQEKEKLEEGQVITL